MAQEKYDHQAIEKKWQGRWAESKVFSVDEKIKGESTFVLDMFPYPSGDGLHVGHPEGYTATDIVSRWLRMNGKKVLHPMGWDAFGLPAENAAIKKGIHPRLVTEQNVKNFKRQIQSIGFSYDWDRELNTTDPKYYTWTQWIFLQLYKAGLAYEKESPIWWCPKDKTGLANEEVVGGVCDRCGTAVEKKMLRQWNLKITAYADRLLQGLEKLNWPESIKALQRNWIGRSEGAQIKFSLRGITGQDNDKHFVEVYTTRPDTIFGATFLVVSPELAQTWLDVGWKASVAVKKYIMSALTKTEIDRQDMAKEKTGVDSGIKAVNPATQEEIPVWVADYVLGSYGTGAIMAVPAHDERDFEFAKKFNLPVKYVVVPHLVDPKNPPRTGKKSQERETVQAIIYNKKTKKYLCLQWKEQPWMTFVVGGVESGEDALAAATREILEETGYKHVTYVKQLGGPVRAEYFAAHKDENRIATAVALLFTLDDEERDEVSDEEQKKHEVIWRSRSELTPESMNCVELPHWLKNLEQDTTYSGEGLMHNSAVFNGLPSDEGRTKIVAWLEKENVGRPKTQYKLRDWVFSRQRYWGEPIPLVHCEKDGVVPVPEDQLPVLLPDVEKYEPTGTGESPLAAIDEWVNTTCPKCGGSAKRETNTMPQWAGSCWYYIRFTDPKNEQAIASDEAMKAWLPVDLYVGGAEHAVLHLLYARFWHKVLFDAGAIPPEVGDEPFVTLKNQGLILGPDGEKMSKSRGNVINPDEIIVKYGADTLRMYEMFMGPFEDAKPWDTNGIVGVRRFLDRVWALQSKVDYDEAGRTSASHKYAQAIGQGIEHFQFNTCVSDLMKWSNEWKSAASIPSGDFEVFLKLLAPFAPHISEELWTVTNHETLLAQEPWPEVDASLLGEDTATVAVQVMGKLRATISMPTGSDQMTVEAAAKSEVNVIKFLTSEPKKVIFVQNKLINFVL